MRLRQALAALSFAVSLLVVILSLSLPSSPHMEEVYEEMLRSKHTFIKQDFTLNIEGSTVNPLASQVSWLEDLSWKDPPVCKNDSDPFILAVVISAVANFEQRARVRNTWGQSKFYEYTGIKPIFVVGSPGNNDTLQDAVDDENDTYEDIIQGDFVDTYRNLTYKTVAWLSWVKDFCPNTPFIAKIDDDVIVNPFNLRLYLQRHLAENPSPKNIHGRARFRAKPMRYSKWEVTMEEYPGDSYPPIVLGSAYIVDRNAVDVLLAYVPYVPFLWLEDVFLTGLVAQKAGIQLKQAERKLYSRKLSRRLYYGSSAFLIDPKPTDYEKGWKGILMHSQKIVNKLQSAKERAKRKEGVAKA